MSFWKNRIDSEEPRLSDEPRLHAVQRTSVIDANANSKLGISRLKQTALKQDLFNHRRTWMAAFMKDKTLRETFKMAAERRDCDQR